VIRLAAAALIEGDDPVRPREAGDLRRPQGPVHAEGVAADEYRTRSPALVDDPHAADARLAAHARPRPAFSIHEIGPDAQRFLPTTTTSDGLASPLRRRTV
jgi:hypothetical protein